MTPNEIAALYGLMKANANGVKDNTPEKALVYWTRAQTHFLAEIAYQLAVTNERNHKQAEAKQDSRKTAGHREKRSTMRKTSTTMYFRPSTWNIECPLDDLRQFMPNADQPELQDMDVGQVSIGHLGTKDDVEVRRIR